MKKRTKAMLLTACAVVVLTLFAAGCADDSTKSEQSDSTSEAVGGAMQGADCCDPVLSVPDPISRV